MAYWEGGVCAKPGGHAGTTRCSLSVTTSNVWNNYGIQAAMVGYSWADIVDAWGFDIIVGNYAASNNPGGAGATSTKSHPRWNKTAKKPDGGQRNSPIFPRRWGWDYTITCYTQYRDLNPTVYQGIVKGTITIPKIAAPQHSIKAVSNKTAVCYGEQVTLTLTDVPGTVNSAHMWNFLITTGDKTIKTGDKDNTAGRSESGSSPHARGAPNGAIMQNVMSGIIPACAGSTAWRPPVAFEKGDHPRMRGEHPYP